MLPEIKLVSSVVLDLIYQLKEIRPPTPKDKHGGNHPRIVEIVAIPLLARFDVTSESLAHLFLTCLRLSPAAKHADTDRGSIEKNFRSILPLTFFRVGGEGGMPEGIIPQNKTCFGRRPHESLMMLIVYVDGDDVLHANAACMCLRWEDAPTGPYEEATAARAPREEGIGRAHKKPPLGCVRPPGDLLGTLCVPSSSDPTSFSLVGIDQGYPAATVFWDKVWDSVRQSGPHDKTSATASSCTHRPALLESLPHRWPSGKRASRRT